MSAVFATNPLASASGASVPLIEARGLHTYYGESHVLHGVDLRLMPGETLSLMGRNGMGKTTTLKSILGFVPPREGEVRIKGKSTAKRRPWQLIRQGIGYVPEGRGIFPGISVREHLIMAARPNERGESPWTLERVLDTFPRLGQRINHDGSFLSGGEQQMLSIGRALTTNPDMVILDEATEGLAPLIRDEIWKIIREIKASGIASIIVDKNIDNLLEVADKHLLLVKGEVVYSGDSRGLREDPSILDTHLGVA
ncbi:branched-chain amino acid transport system ATP-binding protein [Halomonas campaniensis]|uniref:Branched-chain amino acid transport system ATP-binding protein n=1 Tax=Halomonas campaniensis TaxID=213554 RepID=A0A7W5K3P7_9GAMM|nr:ABC transporter ATP-binding protein [Halomonas campaniensis]MBB3331379.1 branched-chain amino acid transport system ATP-binding protein [Halomonas campaniensis]